MLWIVRHGESIGNVAAARAVEAAMPAIDLPMDELDITLSPLGERQARALGQWFAALSAEETPTAIFASPYARARRTAELVRTTAGIERTVRIDERLREKDLGVLNRLTNAGVAERYPEQLNLRKQLGKFYYRPPGGESWCDIALRLRSFMDMLGRDYDGERVLIACHSVLVLLFRYLLEDMEVAQLMAADRGENVANCSVTSYRRNRRGQLVLELFNYVAPLEEAGETITEEVSAAEVATEHD